MTKKVKSEKMVGSVKKLTIAATSLILVAFSVLQ